MKIIFYKFTLNFVAKVCVLVLLVIGNSVVAVRVERGISS